MIEIRGGAPKTVIQTHQSLVFPLDTDFFSLDHGVSFGVECTPSPKNTPRPTPKKKRCFYPIPSRAEATKMLLPDPE